MTKRTKRTLTSRAIFSRRPPSIGFANEAKTEGKIGRRVAKSALVVHLSRVCRLNVTLDDCSVFNYWDSSTIDSYMQIHYTLKRLIPSIHIYCAHIKIVLSLSFKN